MFVGDSLVLFCDAGCVVLFRDFCFFLEGGLVVPQGDHTNCILYALQ